MNRSSGTPLWLCTVIALAAVAVGPGLAQGAIPAGGQAGLPLPSYGYTGDIFGGTVDLRNDFRLVVRPKTVRIGNEEWSSYRGLSWSGWGTKNAQASGTVYRCTENGCALAGRATVKVAAKRSYGCENGGRGVQIYTRVGFVDPAATKTRWLRIIPSIYC